MLKNVIRWTAFAAAIGCMVFIFYQSAQRSSASTQKSRAVTEVIVSHTESDYVEKSETEQKYRVATVDPKNRKYYHVIEFAGFAFFTAVFAILSAKKKKDILPAALLSLLFCVLYASGDEWHQTFVEGRSGRLADVGIDSIGVLIGTIVALLVVLIGTEIIRGMRQRKTKS